MALVKHKNTHIEYRKIIFYIFFATILVTGASFGWIKFQEEQEKKIILAQNLLVKECLKPTVNNNFSETAKNVDRAVKLLDSIPQLPGSTYPKAQTELANFSECIKTVNAKNSFITAQLLSKRALSVDNQTILPITEWRKIRLDLTAAIIQIDSIPSDIEIGKEAQKELKKYQNQLKVIDKNIQDEQLAIEGLNNARNLKIAAENMIRRQNNLQSLSRAELRLKDAITIMIKLPEGTTISAQKNDYLQTYQSLLNDIQDKIAVIRINDLVNTFRKFAGELNTKIEYAEYSEDVEKLKSNFNNTIKESSAIKNNPTTKSLAKALSHYEDALIIKRYCYEGNCINSGSAFIFQSKWKALWIPVSFKLGSVPITEKYILPVTSNILRKKYVKVDEALAWIWAEAEAEIEQIK